MTCCEDVSKYMTKTLKAFSDAKKNIDSLIDDVVTPTPIEECEASDPTEPCIVSKDEAKEFANEDLESTKDGIMGVFSLLSQTENETCCSSIAEAAFCIATNYISTLYSAYEFGTPTILSSKENDKVAATIFQIIATDDLKDFYTEVTLTDILTFGIRYRVKEAISLLKLIVPQQSCYNNETCCEYLAINISQSFSVIVNGYVDGAAAIGNFGDVIESHNIAKAALAVVKLTFLQLTPFRSIALSKCECCKEAAESLTCLITAVIQYYTTFVNMEFVDENGQIIIFLDVTLKEIEAYFNAIYNPMFSQVYPQGLKSILGSIKCNSCNGTQCCYTAINSAKFFAYAVDRADIVYHDMIEGLGGGNPINAPLVSLIIATIYKKFSRVMYAINSSTCKDCCRGITESLYCLSVNALTDALDYLQSWKGKIDYEGFINAEPGNYTWADDFFEDYSFDGYDRSLNILKSLLECECKIHSDEDYRCKEEKEYHKKSKPHCKKGHHEKPHCKKEHHEKPHHKEEKHKGCKCKNKKVYGIPHSK